MLPTDSLRESMLLKTKTVSPHATRAPGASRRRHRQGKGAEAGKRYRYRTNQQSIGNAKMATEEERAKIMAEYLAGADEDDGLGDFDPDDEDPEESDAYEDDDSADGGKKKKAAPDNSENYAVLDGKVLLNEEGRVSYVGTWQMKRDLDAAAAAAEFEDDGVGKKPPKKKKQKFKLKSKQTMSTDGSGEGPIFLLDKPTVSKKKDSETIPPKRTIMFDGFFFTPEEEGHRKIKEKDVEITFSVVEGDPKSFKLQGNGINDFGAFTIEGTYKSSGNDGSNPLVTNKKYVPVGGDDGDFDDEASDDDEMSDAEEAEYGELVALNEEANMSVEELRKRYYGGGGGGAGGDDDDEDDAKPAAKKSKVVADDSDDEACGF